MGYPVVGVEVPDVEECHGGPKAHRRPDGTYATSCSQCDGSHAHLWTVVVVPKGMYGRPETALRCAICGARACSAIADDPRCILRRHHLDPHAYTDGSFRPVGR